MHDAHGRGLRAGILGGAEVAAQSVATMTPTAAIAITPLLVWGWAGNGTWLAFVVAVALMASVAYCASHFARRANSSASAYAWVTRALGPLAGHTAGWALTLGYLFLGSVTVLAFVVYATAFLAGYGLGSHQPVLHAVLFVAGWAGAAALSARGVRLSARAALVLEVGAGIVVVALCVATWVHQGSPFDRAQLSLSGVHPGGLAVGVVLAVFACVGFESAAALGRESRRPGRHVTRAILGSCLAVGAYYVVVAYSTAYGFRHVRGGLAAQAAPLPALAGVVGLGWLGHLVALAIAASTLGGTVACLNAGGRMVYTFAREGFLPPRLGRAGRVTGTPVAALAAVAVPMALLPAAWRWAGSTPTALIGDLAVPATFGFMLAYALVCVGAPRVAVDAGLRLRLSAAGAVGTLGMAFVAYVNWVPQLVSNGAFPALGWPLWALPYVFFGWVLAGLGWYGALRRRRAARPAEALAAEQAG